MLPFLLGIPTTRTAVFAQHFHSLFARSRASLDLIISRANTIASRAAPSKWQITNRIQHQTSFVPSSRPLSASPTFRRQPTNGKKAHFAGSKPPSFARMTRVGDYRPLFTSTSRSFASLPNSSTRRAFQPTLAKLQQRPNGPPPPPEDLLTLSPEEIRYFGFDRRVTADVVDKTLSNRKRFFLGLNATLCLWCLSYWWYRHDLNIMFIEEVEQGIYEPDAPRLGYWEWVFNKFIVPKAEAKAIHFRTRDQIKRYKLSSAMKRGDLPSFSNEELAQLEHEIELEQQSKRKVYIPAQVMDEIINKTSKRAHKRILTPLSASNDPAYNKQYGDQDEDTIIMYQGKPMIVPGASESYDDIALSKRVNGMRVNINNTGVPTIDMHQFRQANTFQQCKTILSMVIRGMFPSFPFIEPVTGHHYAPAIEQQIPLPSNDDLMTRSLALLGTGVRSMMNLTWIPAATAYSIGVFVDASVAIYHFTNILPYYKNIQKINELRKNHLQQVPVYDIKKPPQDSPIYKKKGKLTEREQAKVMEQLSPYVGCVEIGPEQLELPDLPSVEEVLTHSPSTAIILTMARSSEGKHLAHGFERSLSSRFCDGTTEKTWWGGRSVTMDDGGIPIPMTPATLGYHKYNIQTDTHETLVQHGHDLPPLPPFMYDQQPISLSSHLSLKMLTSLLNMTRKFPEQERIGFIWGQNKDAVTIRFPIEMLPVVYSLMNKPDMLVDNGIKAIMHENVSRGYSISGYDYDLIRRYIDPQTNSIRTELIEDEVRLCDYVDTSGNYDRQGALIPGKKPSHHNMSHKVKFDPFNQRIELVDTNQQPEYVDLVTDHLLTAIDVNYEDFHKTDEQKRDEQQFKEYQEEKQQQAAEFAKANPLIALNPRLANDPSILGEKASDGDRMLHYHTLKHRHGNITMDQGVLDLINTHRRVIQLGETEGLDLPSPYTVHPEQYNIVMFDPHKTIRVIEDFCNDHTDFYNVWDSRVMPAYDYYTDALESDVIIDALEEENKIDMDVSPGVMTPLESQQASEAVVWFNRSFDNEYDQPSKYFQADYHISGDNGSKYTPRSSVKPPTASLSVLQSSPEAVVEQRIADIKRKTQLLEAAKKKKSQLHHELLALDIHQPGAKERLLRALSETTQSLEQLQQDLSELYQKNGEEDSDSIASRLPPQRQREADILKLFSVDPDDLTQSEEDQLIMEERRRAIQLGDEESLKELDMLSNEDTARAFLDKEDGLTTLDPEERKRIEMEAVFDDSYSYASAIMSQSKSSRQKEYLHDMKEERKLRLREQDRQNAGLSTDSHAAERSRRQAEETGSDLAYATGLNIRNGSADITDAFISPEDKHRFVNEIGRKANRRRLQNNTSGRPTSLQKKFFQELTHLTSSQQEDLMEEQLRLTEEEKLFKQLEEEEMHKIERLAGERDMYLIIRDPIFSSAVLRTYIGGRGVDPSLIETLRKNWTSFTHPALEKPLDKDGVHPDDIELRLMKMDSEELDLFLAMEQPAAYMM